MGGKPMFNENLVFRGKRQFIQFQCAGNQNLALFDSQRRQLLENFDAEVHDKLRVNLDQSRDYLNRYERLLMQLTRFELAAEAEFLDGQSGFRLHTNPFPDTGEIPLGLYELPRRTGAAHLYRLGHPLAQRILARAKGRDLGPVESTFDHTGAAAKVAALQPLVGQSGELLVSLFTVESLDHAEDHVLVAALTDRGQMVDEDAARRVFSLPATAVKETAAMPINPRLQEELDRRQSAICRRISERNATVFEAEADKLDGWADDLKVALEQEIKDFDRQIKEAKRAATASPTLEEKLAGQKQVRAIEALRNNKRKSLFDAQDEIDRRRDKLIAEIEGKLTQKTAALHIVSFRWTIV